MFYLINKSTNEIEAEDEKKSAVRKLYKSKEDKENWVVSKFKPDDAPVRNARKKSDDEEKLTSEQKKKLDELYARMENPNRNMTGFQHTTTLLPSRDAVLRMMKHKKAISYRIERHATGQWFAFYDTEEGVAKEKPKTKKELRKERKAEKKLREEQDDTEPDF